MRRVKIKFLIILGDVILTGTPAGVGPVEPGIKLSSLHIKLNMKNNYPM